MPAYQYNGRRVVITGLGSITPLGHNTESTWDAALAGRSGVWPLTACPAQDLETRIAAEVRDFDPAAYLGVKEARHLDRAVQLALVATKEAIAGAGIDPAGPNGAVVMGTGMAGLLTLSEQLATLNNRGPSRVTPHLIPMMLPSMLASQVAIAWQINGPCFEISSACASGAQALAQAAEMIAAGRVKYAIAGGAEAPLVRIGVAGLSRMGALSRNNDHPTQASRPFDLHRDGFVLAEGAATLVLEERDSAIQRGATILAELIGWGVTCDAFHVTQPLADGTHAARAMEMAITSAGLRPQDVDYLNAHATSTTLGDRAEVKAIRSVFGDKDTQPLIGATKSMTGHLVGAAGALEAVLSVLSIRDGAIPPTINLETLDPDCDLNHVTETRRQPVNIALSNSFGFGGHNVVLAFAAAVHRHD